MNFSEKTVLCNTEDTHAIIRETELQWIAALLLRLKLDPARIKAMTTSGNNYSNQAWRDYLVLDCNIGITKFATETLIEKHFDNKPKVLLGKWQQPEIVRVKEDGKWHVELRLNYWQLI